MKNEDLTNPELAVLGLVAENPKHGYQVEQDIEQRGFREWTEVGFSSIYHILNKLETAGLLLSQRQPSAGLPARKVYHLTSAGRRACADAVRRRLQQPRPRSSDFDLALANLATLPPHEALQAVNIYIASLKATLENVEGKLLAGAGRGTMPFHVTALFDHSLSALHNELVWLEGFSKKLSVEAEE
jgi:DNA-binding PadR family transcriptional regulator